MTQDCPGNKMTRWQDDKMTTQDCPGNKACDPFALKFISYCCSYISIEWLTDSENLLPTLNHTFKSWSRDFSWWRKNYCFLLNLFIHTFPLPNCFSKWFAMFIFVNAVLTVAPVHTVRVFCAFLGRRITCDGGGDDGKHFFETFLFSRGGGRECLMYPTIETFSWVDTALRTLFPSQVRPQIVNLDYLRLSQIISEYIRLSQILHLNYLRVQPVSHFYDLEKSVKDAWLKGRRWVHQHQDVSWVSMSPRTKMTPQHVFMILWFSNNEGSTSSSNRPFGKDFHFYRSLPWKKKVVTGTFSNLVMHLCDWLHSLCLLGRLEKPKDEDLENHSKDKSAK